MISVMADSNSDQEFMALLGNLIENVDAGNDSDLDIKICVSSVHTPVTTDVESDIDNN